MREKRERQVIVKRFAYGKAPHFVTKHGALLKYGVNRPCNYGLALQGSLLPSFGSRLTQVDPTNSPLDCSLNRSACGPAITVLLRKAHCCLRSAVASLSLSLQTVHRTVCLTASLWPCNYGLASQGSLLPSFGCRLTQAKPTDSPQDCLLNGLAR